MANCGRSQFFSTESYKKLADKLGQNCSCKQALGREGGRELGVCCNVFKNVPAVGDRTGESCWKDGHSCHLHVELLCEFCGPDVEY